MKTLIFFLASTLILLMVTGCNPVTYISNAVNVPLLHEKHEIKASFANDNAQVSYALTDHIGLMANTFWYNNDIVNDVGASIGLEYGHLTEVGAGYYNAKHQPLIFELYGGFGLGGLLNRENKVMYYSSKGNRIFAQGNLGLSYKYFDIGIGQRFSSLQYYDFQVRGYTASEIDTYQLNKSILESRRWLFYEPAITLRGGYKFIKVQIQLGAVIKLTKGPLSYVDEFNNIGVVLDLAKWYK